MLLILLFSLLFLIVKLAIDKLRDLLYEYEEFQYLMMIFIDNLNS